MSDLKLQIQPQPSAEAMFQQFILIGTIDIDAIPVLETLYVLPQGGSVELNFAQVQRVNSMGLAQLLKLFEHWQKRYISIQISQTNRMVGVLFKMTGLTRFLTDKAPSDIPTSLASKPEQRQKPEQLSVTAQPVIPGAVNPVQSPVTERRHNLEPVPSIQPSMPGTDGKINLWVSAQSSQQMNGWYFFNTYLQRHLGREVHLELVHGSINERRKAAEDMDIVFTKPFEATRLLLEHNFHSLLRPIDQTDEVTLLVRADDARQAVTDFHEGKIVTAASDNFVYLLGRFLLEESGLVSEHFEYLFSGHDIKALQMLLKGNADMLFMLSDTYRGLSGLAKKMLREIDQSETAFAFHLFCVAPHCLALGEALAEVLLDMSRDSQGRQILADLGIEGWIRPSPDEINMLVMLFRRYADIGSAGKNPSSSHADAMLSN